MSSWRKIVAAVIAGLTGACLLLAAVAGEADELSDLRQNRQALEKRLDRLAPSDAAAPAPARPETYGAPPASGQPLPSGSFPRSFLIPGTSTSIRIGGAVDATGAYEISR